MNKYLRKIKSVKNECELVKFIRNIFREFDKDQYMPALINEGLFTVDSGEDFYLKLVLKHSTKDINKTWMKDNLSLGLCEPEDDDAYVHNVLVYRRYKSNNLYQVNPLIVNELVSEYEYNNTEFVNAYYNDEYNKLKGKPVLKKDDNIKLLIIKDILKDYINDINDNVYPKFQLVAEFEYRTHENHIDNICEKYNSNDAFLSIDKNQNSTYILGSVYIPYVYNNDYRECSRNIKVLDLNSLTERKHNPKNCDGDINEGLIYFKKDIISILKEEYYIYDLHMYNKNNINDSYIVDILDDKVMFFEGEYNRLPNELKEIIDIYNFIPVGNIKNLISFAMYKCKLEGDWNWSDNLLPNFELAYEIRNRMFSNAIDIGLSFEFPESSTDLRNFIYKIERLTSIKLEGYNQESNEVKELIGLRDEGLEIKKNDLKNIYLKYCYEIVRRLKYYNEK